ncbi:DUF805 domain-containing protein [Hyphomonas sp.]|uniref:DUF805 domain-containing protein n=1 Tax=Hyphomonas sp. TaxID=87 RepID=UPI00391BFED3
MKLVDVLFKPRGRIEARQFWLGWGIIVAANIVANFLSFLGIILYLGLIYVGVCVYGKRLHDMGRSAWLVAIPWGVGLVLGTIGLFLCAPAIMEATQYDPRALEDPEAAMAVMGPYLALIGLGFVVWAAFTVWVGIGKSDPNENEHGGNPQNPAASADVFV